MGREVSPGHEALSRAPLTYLPTSGRTVVKSRTARSAVRRHLILVVSRKAGIFRKNFTKPKYDTMTRVKHKRYMTHEVSAKMNGMNCIVNKRISFVAR